MNNSLNLNSGAPNTAASNSTPKSGYNDLYWSSCPAHPLTNYDAETQQTTPNYYKPTSTTFNNITPSTGSEKTLPTNTSTNMSNEALEIPQKSNSQNTDDQEKLIHIEILNESGNKNLNNCNNDTTNMNSKSPESFACHCIDRKLPYTVNEKNVWQVFEITDCKFVQTKLEHYETHQYESINTEEAQEPEKTPQHIHSRSSFDENQFVCHTLLKTPTDATLSMPVPPMSAPKTCESCCFCNPDIHTTGNAECKYCKNKTPQLKTTTENTEQYYETLAIDHTHTTHENNTTKCTKISETVKKRIISSATSTGTIKKITSKINENSSIPKSPTKLLNRPKETAINQPRKRVKSVKKEVKNEIKKMYPIAIEVKDKKAKKTR